MTWCRVGSRPATAARSATVLPAPTSPVTTPSADIHDAEADPGDGLGVGLAGEQVLGGDGLAERGAGQAEVRGPGRGAHRSSWPASPAVSMASWVKSILAPVPAASSWAAATRPRESIPVGAGSGRAAWGTARWTCRRVTNGTAAPAG